MVGIAAILVLGVAAQLLAWKLRLPSILLLLLIGFLAGPATGWLDPDELFGDALFPVVSLAVAVILLEGGMSLRFRELAGVRAATRNLILFGAPLTWGGVTLAAHYVLGFEPGLALLLGAILIVTGPTVILPLLRHVRPSGSVAAVIRWEGIVNDPIGAIVAVLVFRGIVLADAEQAVFAAVAGALTAAIVGGLFGALAAGALVLLMRRFLVPDYLQNPVALALGIASFVASNAVLHETGLLAVTVMGVVLANQRFVAIEHILEFKENLRVLLISSLFILLSARVPAAAFLQPDLQSFLFVGLLILVVRPASVFVATLRTGLSWREKVFVSWMAPRGIVAAAVASVFAIELEQSLYPEPERLVSVMFLVIVATVAVYGLTAGPLARLLGLSRSHPEGVLIVGAHGWGRAVAAVLRDQGFDVLLVDTNRENVRAARLEGLPVWHGNVLSEELHGCDLGGIGRILAMTSNDEVNALTALEFTSTFGRSEVYQLAPSPEEAAAGQEMSAHLRGRVLFEKGLSFWDLNARYRAGAVVKATPLTEEFDYAAFRERHGDHAIPLFALAEGRLRVFTAEAEPDPKPGETLVHLVWDAGG